MLSKSNIFWLAFLVVQKYWACTLLCSTLAGPFPYEMFQSYFYVILSSNVENIFILLQNSQWHLYNLLDFLSLFVFLACNFEYTGWLSQVEFFLLFIVDKSHSFLGLFTEPRNHKIINPILGYCSFKIRKYIQLHCTWKLEFANFQRTKT